MDGKDLMPGTIEHFLQEYEKTYKDFEKFVFAIEEKGKAKRQAEMQRASIVAAKMFYEMYYKGSFCSDEQEVLFMGCCLAEKKDEIEEILEGAGKDITRKLRKLGIPASVEILAGGPDDGE